MLYKLTKQIRENGGATKEDLKALEPYLSTGPIKFDNSRFYKNVDFIKQNYDILDYVTREIDVSHIQNEKLAEIVFYLNMLFGKVNTDIQRLGILFETNHHLVNEFYKRLTNNINYWNTYYKKDEEPFTICTFQGIHNMASHMSFHLFDDKILDLLLNFIYTNYIFKVTEAMPNDSRGYPLRSGEYRFLIDNKIVNRVEFEFYRNKVDKFTEKMIGKYKLVKETK